MGDGQARYLRRAQVYNLIAEGREDAIVSMGEKAIPGLISILDNGEDWQKRIAVSVLGKIDGPESVRALKFAADDYDNRIKEAALHALARKEGRGIEQTLKEVWRKDVSPQIRSTAKKLLDMRSSIPPAPLENNGNAKALKARP